MRSMVLALVAFGVFGCRSRSQATADPVPASEGSTAPTKPSAAGSTSASTKPSVAGPMSDSASFVVKHAFGQSVDFSFRVDATELKGPFRAEAGKTTKFVLPPGRLVWGPAACSLSEESLRRATVTLARGDVVHVDCWQSDREGMCCEQRSIERASE